MQISSYRREVLERPGRARRRDAARAVPAPPPSEPRRRSRRRPRWEAKLAGGGRRGGGDGGAARIACWHVGWARKTERTLLDGTAPTSRRAIHAIRIGDGVIVSGPGEVFSEIGMAVKERGPGPRRCTPASRTDWSRTSPTAAEYPYGGYEADYSCRGHGNPSHVAPAVRADPRRECVRAAEDLPRRRAWDGGRGWTASGELPDAAPPGPARPSGRADARARDQLQARLDRAPRRVGVEDHRHPPRLRDQVGHRVALVDPPAALGVVLGTGEVTERRSCSRARTCRGAASARGSRARSRRTSRCSSRRGDVVDADRLDAKLVGRCRPRPPRRAFGPSARTSERPGSPSPARRRCAAPRASAASGRGSPAPRSSDGSSS